ncbi:MAG: PHP domain-containing protein [Hadesarchaea archaeon]|nr:PHP domain-containing protein [Hadesarchaea archaeon]
MNLFRYDLHVHTRYSRDGHCTLPEAIRMAKSRGLSGIAITDHDSIGGNLEAARLNLRDFVIIPGIEVSSKDGHILGFNVTEPIPPGLPAAETVALIRRQGGVAVAAHPFGLGRKIGGIHKARFDAIEVFNSRTYFGNSLAREFAERNKLPMVAGSDAHYPDEIGLAGVEMTCEPKVDAVLSSIARGETAVFGHVLPLFTYLRRAVQKLVLK